MTGFSPDPRDLGASPSPPERPDHRPAHRPAQRAAQRPNGDDLDALARRARYSRWDGSQRRADLEADEIMDALSGDVMAEGDLGRPCAG